MGRFYGWISLCIVSMRNPHLFLYLCSFFAEWKTSLEKLSFQGSQIGSRIFAEAKLQPASFLTLLQLARSSRQR